MRRIGYTVLMAFLAVAFASEAAAQEQRTRVNDVTVEGNEVFSDNRLFGVMLSKPSRFLQSNWFNQRIFDDDMNNIELFYHQQGFLQAAVTERVLRFNPDSTQVDISLKVDEGEQTTIGGIGIFDNTTFPDSLLLARTGLAVGDPFRADDIEQATNGIVTLYADSGFVDVNVVPDTRINEEIHEAYIDFQIDERNRYKIDAITVTGLDKTKRSVLMREVRFSPGDVISYSQLLATQHRIYLTGLFRSVFIEPVEPAGGGYGLKDIRIEVEEALNTEVNAAIGYGSEDKFRSRVEYYNTNIGGTARKMGAAGKLSFNNRNLTLSFTEPWTFGSRWQTDINGFWDRVEEPGYVLTHYGGLLTVGRTIRDHVKISATYRQEFARLSHLTTAELPDDITPHIRSINLAAIYDTRDNLFNATRGWYVELSHEFGDFTQRPNTPFFRIIMRTKYFHPFTSGTVLATSLEAGWMNANGGLTIIPLQERFYAGGPSSIRGFRYQKVGTLDSNGVPVGGRIKLVWNLIELRQHIWRWFGGAVFVDAGNIWELPKNMSFGSIRWTSGAGIRLHTPIGVGRVDWGYVLDRKTGEPRSRFYFNLGQPF